MNKFSKLKKFVNLITFDNQILLFVKWYYKEGNNLFLNFRHGFKKIVFSHITFTQLFRDSD